jgi:hypothetical protein
MQNMPDRKTPTRHLRKRSFRAGFVLAFSFIGIALGSMLAHRTPAPSEFQVQSPIGGNHGPEHSDGEVILESTDATPRMRSPGKEEADGAEASIPDGIRRIEELGLRGDALSSLLYDSTGITPEDIPPTLSIQEFAAHVAAIATQGIWTGRERASMPADLTVADIRFGTSPRPSESTESPRTRFSPYDTRIFAVFDTGTYTYPSVLVKWCRIDQPELFVLQKYEIEPCAASNYVWYNKTEGWPSGQYRVEVYSLGEGFAMMSSGQYEVSQN